MAIASSTSSRRQCSSHGAEQTRPSTDGNGIVRLKIRADSRKLPSALALRKPGMSMWLPHLFCEGGRPRGVVARALVLAGRQAVGVVVREDQFEVRPPQPADLFGLRLDLHVRLARSGA